MNNKLAKRLRKAAKSSLPLDAPLVIYNEDYAPPVFIDFNKHKDTILTDWRKVANGIPRIVLDTSQRGAYLKLKRERRKFDNKL